MLDKFFKYLNNFNFYLGSLKGKQNAFDNRSDKVILCISFGEEICPSDQF